MVFTDQVSLASVHGPCFFVSCLQPSFLDSYLQTKFLWLLFTNQVFLLLFTDKVPLASVYRLSSFHLFTGQVSLASVFRLSSFGLFTGLVSLASVYRLSFFGFCLQTKFLWLLPSSFGLFTGQFSLEAEKSWLQFESDRWGLKFNLEGWLAISYFHDLCCRLVITIGCCSCVHPHPIQADCWLVLLTASLLTDPCFSLKALQLQCL